jgi:hypothetical protein
VHHVRNRILGITLLALAAGGLAPAAVPATRACAPVMPKDRAVAVASESALIVWDGRAKQEHFIRRASFRTDVYDFGFLVPTPALPELAEVPDEVFGRLEEWTKPEEKTETVYVDRPLIDIGCGMAGFKADAPAGLADRGVEEFGQVRVAGYDATRLKAADTKALQGWLEERGYDARPTVMRWLEPYVKGGWFITAFRIAPKEQVGQVGTQAVRMSFAADRPFFPYREPEDQGPAAGGQQRLLRVFLLGDRRTQGALDEPTPWPGKAEWAGKLGDEQRQALGQHLGPAVSLPEGAWLTVFDDTSSPRPGTTDLFFSPAADQSEVRRDPVVHHVYVERYSPGEIITAVLGLVLCAGMLLVPAVLLGLLLRKGRAVPPGGRTA